MHVAGLYKLKCRSWSVILPMIYDTGRYYFSLHSDTSQCLKHYRETYSVQRFEHTSICMPEASQLFWLLSKARSQNLPAICIPEAKEMLYKYTVFDET